MTTQAEFYGGSEEIAISTVPENYVLGPGSPRVIVVSSISGGGGPNGLLRLPDARLLKVGGPIFYILNNDAAKDIELNDNLGNMIDASVIPITEGALALLLDNSTQEGTWIQINFPNIPIL